MSLGTPTLEAPCGAKSATPLPAANEPRRDTSFTLIVASNDLSCAERYEAAAAGSLRQITLDGLFEATDAQVEAGIATANMLLIAAGATSSPVIGRFIERLRFAESVRGVFGMRRFNVAVVLGDNAESLGTDTVEPEELDRRVREVRAFGAQYSFNANQVEDVAALLRSSASTHRAGRDRRRNQRFQDLKEVCVQTSDGSRQIAMVADESFSGIALKVLDPTIFSYRSRVSVFVAGAPMPAHVVRISGRDENARCLIALRWGTL